ncbi:MAG TPA: hypothetical protein PLN21_15840 [Gemmatales bacterium]|nr:hypothetical protein [Gemmatales bacterium]
MATKLSKRSMSFVISPNAKNLAIVSGIQVIIISLKNLKIQKVLKHRLRITSAIWRNDDYLITASDDYHIREWDIRRGSERIIFSTPRWIWSLSLSADKTRLLIGTEDNMMGPNHCGHAMVINLNTGKPLSDRMQHPGTVLQTL